MIRTIIRLVQVNVSPTRKIVALVLALLAFAGSERFIGYDILSRVDRFEMVLTGEGPADIRIYFQRPPASRSFDAGRLVQNSTVLDENERVLTKLDDRLPYCSKSSSRPVAERCSCARSWFTATTLPRFGSRGGR